MSVTVSNRITINKIVLLQFITCLVISLVFVLKNPFLGVSSLLGGLSVCLPNALFGLFTEYNLKSAMVTETIKGSFFIGWIMKFITTIVLLVISIVVVKVAMVPFGIAFLIMLMMHILAPCLIDKFRK